MTTPEHLAMAAAIPLTQLTPRLFVGSCRALDDGGSLLVQVGVTAIVSIAPKLSEETKASVRSNGFTEVHFIERSHREFDSHPESAEELIRMVHSLMDARGRSHVVFVHCRSGIHRSIAVVVGYLMVAERTSWRRAFSFVKLLRPCASNYYRQHATRAAKNMLSQQEPPVVLTD